MASDLGLHFTKTRPFKYSENFTSKNMKKHMKKYQNFYLKISFLVVKFSIYLNRRVFVMFVEPDQTTLTVRVQT